MPAGKHLKTQMYCIPLAYPQTKQTVECRDPWGDMRRTRQIEHCVDAYKKAGYDVVGDSDK